MNNTNYLFMAFASGRETTDSQEIKRYIGVAPVFVLAVNPTKDELEKIYNNTSDNAPEYLSKTEVNGREVEQVRIDFIVQTNTERSNGIDLKTKLSFFLTNMPKYNRDGSKVQVINKYGETTWLSIEDAKNKVIPSNLSWFEAADIRPAYIGEAELTIFIKKYLNIPNKSYRKSNGELVELENKADAEARLDCISNYFKGDFSELKTIASLLPNNEIKCMFGVRTTDDGKMYQAVYSHEFVKNNVTDYSKLDEDLQNRKQNGAYPTTEFSVCDLKEYTVESTTFTPSDQEMPNMTSPWFN